MLQRDRVDHRVGEILRHACHRGDACMFRNLNPGRQITDICSGFNGEGNGSVDGINNVLNNQQRRIKRKTNEFGFIR